MSNSKIISNRLPTFEDADANGDIFAYASQRAYTPIPWESMSFEYFIGWRRIEEGDYLNPPEPRKAGDLQNTVVPEPGDVTP